MGRYRQREVEIDLPDGQEMRVADAPVSEPVRRLKVMLVPLYDGPYTPAGAGTITAEVYLGGGYEQDPKVYAVPHFDTGIQQGATAALPGGTLTFPVTIYEDTSGTPVPADRVRDGWRVREDGNRARALYLRNNCGGGKPLRCKAIFISETVSESG